MAVRRFEAWLRRCQNGEPRVVPLTPLPPSGHAAENEYVSKVDVPLRLCAREGAPLWAAAEPGAVMRSPVVPAALAVTITAAVQLIKRKHARFGMPRTSKVRPSCTVSESDVPRTALGRDFFREDVPKKPVNLSWPSSVHSSSRVLAGHPVAVARVIAYHAIQPA